MSAYCARKASQLEKNAHPDFTVKDASVESLGYCTVDVDNGKLRSMSTEARPLSYGAVHINKAGERHDADDWIEGDIPFYDEVAAEERIRDCGGRVVESHEHSLGFFNCIHLHFEGRRRTEACLLRRLLEEP